METIKNYNILSELGKSTLLALNYICLTL